MLTHQLLAPDCEAEDIAEDRCTFLYFYLDGKLVPASVWNKYALALYFATGELMGTPYGDIIPVRGEERLFFIICHLGAGFVNAYLVGGMVKNRRSSPRTGMLSPYGVPISSPVAK